MKILIVAATKEEISVLEDIKDSSHILDFLISGPGMVSTAYELTLKLSTNRYDLAINCGIAGSFDRSISMGEVVSVKHDIFSELVVEDGDKFLSLSEAGLLGKDSFQNSFKIMDSSNLHLKEVRGITVNTVHGNESSILKVINRCNPQIETMEGAAFFFVCEKENIPSLQFRAISNYVEKRNRDIWNIPLALRNLKAALENLLSSL